MNKNRKAWIFAYSTLDFIPVLAGVGHAAYLVRRNGAGLRLFELSGCRHEHPMWSRMVSLA